MAFVSELFDTMRDLLNDPTDTQVTFALKKLYLNRGIARLWPHVWRVVENTSVTVVDGVYDYSVAVAVMDGMVLSVELETGNATGYYERFDGYDIIQGDEDQAGVFRFTVGLPAVGSRVRIRYAAPPSLITAANYAAAGSEAWTGPDRAMGIPVYYAMSLSAARKVDDRQDALTYNTVVAENGVQDSDIMAASQMWMGQFELELAEFDRPMPIARD